MNAMKRILTVVIAVTVCVVCWLAAEASAASAKPYGLRIATHYNQEHLGYAALTRIKEALESKSEGRLKVTLYPSSQLGDYTLTFQEISEGTIDMALIPIPSEYDSRLEMNFIPYLVNDYSGLESAFGKGSYFFGKYTEIMANLDIKLLGIYAEGMIGLGFSKEPAGYKDVNDDSAAKKNLLVRAPAIEVYNLVTQDMGFSSVTIPYADLYTAMQTGVCNGWIGGTPQLNYSDFRDVIEYYVPYNVFVENIGFLMSKEVFEGMPDDLKKLIEDTFMAESVKSYATAKEGDEDAIRKMKDYGIKILELTPAELDAYKQHIIKVTWPKLSKNIGEDILKELIAASGGN